MKDDAILLMAQLTTDVEIKLPVIDLNDPLYNLPGGLDSPLYREVVPLTNEKLTERVVDGQGTFDAIMSGVNAHLAGQWDKGRITGDEYSRAYIALSEAAMSNAVEFLVQRDAAFWTAQTAQLQAITARIQLEIEKAKLVALQAEALNAKANYALTKTSLAKASTEHCILEYQLTDMLPKESAILSGQATGLDHDNTSKLFNIQNVLPKEVNMLDRQILGLEHENAIKLYNLSSIMPKESSMLDTQITGLQHDNTSKLFTINSILPAQHAGLLEDNSIKSYNLTNLLPIDWDTKSYTLSTLMPSQNLLIKEQYEVQRAQTLDTRSEGEAITGTLGKQKDLYTQQIESYKRNSEYQAAKVFSDAWTVMKTIDEGITPPDQFTNANIDTVLGKIRTANNL